MAEDFPRSGEVRDQRASLRSAMHELEAAAGAPVGAGASAWRTEVDRSIAIVQTAWEHHIVLTEAPDGLFNQIRSDAPELAPRIKQLDREHEAFRARLAALASTGSLDTGSVRDSVIDLVAKLARHRQHGSDLIYEAYSVDLGGSG
jgi:hypothetical protein